MMQFPNATKGVRWICWSQIVLLICMLAAVLAVIPFLGIFLGLILLVGAIVTAVWYLAALYIAGRDDRLYSYAFWVALAKTVVSFLTPENGAGATVMNSVGMVLDVVVIYLVCTATDRLLAAVSSEVAGQGAGVWKLYLACAVLNILCNALLLIMPTLGWILAWVTLLLSLAGLVIYMIFLYKSYHALERAGEM